MFKLLRSIQVGISCLLVAFAVISVPLSSITADPPAERGLRTSCLRMNVYPSSEISGNVVGKSFTYFIDQKPYLFDGYLILGNSANNLSYSTELGPDGSLPTATNPYGYLIPDTDAMTIDSTSPTGYRVASGKGYNRDSTIMFDVRWFASKHPDTCNTLIGEFKIYKGPNGGTVTGLTIAYFADWDVPADTGSDNYCGTDPARSMLYQRGAYTNLPNGYSTRYAAMSGLSYKMQIVGGFVVDCPTYLYPEGGVFENDSIWNRMSTLNEGQYSKASGFGDPGAGTGPAENLASVLVLDRNQTVSSSDTLYYGVILAGQPLGGTLSSLQIAIDKGSRFANAHNLVPGAFIDCFCGDCDNNGLITISDAVCMICFIFQGCPPPGYSCQSDADNNGIITISDAVYIINYIFAGGPAPTC